MHRYRVCDGFSMVHHFKETATMAVLLRTTILPNLPTNLVFPRNPVVRLELKCIVSSCTYMKQKPFIHIVALKRAIIPMRKYIGCWKRETPLASFNSSSSSLIFFTSFPTTSNFDGSNSFSLPLYFHLIIASVLPWLACHQFYHRLSFPTCAGYFAAVW